MFNMKNLKPWLLGALLCGRDTFWFWVISAVPFYCSTWERYFTDTLILPVVNGPTEGLRLIYLRISLQLYSVLSSGLNSLGSLCHFHCLAAHDQDTFLTGRTYEEIPTDRSHFVADDSFLLLFQQSIASDSSNAQNSNSEEELTPFFSSLIMKKLLEVIQTFGRILKPMLENSIRKVGTGAWNSDLRT
ncbi:hypothetical protein K7X08_021212 [Anisodus acutangulus]|uniref:Uncharacterized protein n=1 Tax=Anisodus acutangulus TaxID=402998 RepID=A0A9Q1M2D1_9SOLA|nr:hypothetical protein K7X08_021212 [Anisodus acutangulus]